MLSCKVDGFLRIRFVIIELDEERIGLRVAVVLPRNQAIAVSPHGITHEVVLKKIAVP